MFVCGVGRRVADRGWRSLSTRPQRYCDPASLVVSSKVSSAPIPTSIHHRSTRSIRSVSRRRQFIDDYIRQLEENDRKRRDAVRNDADAADDDDDGDGGEGGGTRKKRSLDIFAPDLSERLSFANHDKVSLLEECLDIYIVYGPLNRKKGHFVISRSLCLRPYFASLRIATYLKEPPYPL